MPNSRHRRVLPKRRRTWQGRAFWRDSPATHNRAIITERDTQNRGVFAVALNYMRRLGCWSRAITRNVTKAVALEARALDRLRLGRPAILCPMAMMAALNVPTRLGGPGLLEGVNLGNGHGGKSL